MDVLIVDNQTTPVPVTVTDSQSVIQVVTPVEVPVVIEVATPGPPGPPGDGSGSTGQVYYTAGEVLSGHRVVIIDLDGYAYYGDSSNLDHLWKVAGITTGASLQGDSVLTVVNGPMIEPTWDWIVGKPVFLGLNGLLTQTPPSDGFLQIIGYPVTPTSLRVSIQQPITL